MKISTRGRYAIRVLVDMAEHADGGFIPLKDIAERQEVSHKYLEGIMLILSKNKIVQAVHGKGGGYKLNKSPEECTVGEVLRATEGTLAPVACLETGAEPCGRTADCRTLGMWKELYALIVDFFDGKTIKDLMRPSDGGDYVI
ncbi:MAG: Rrf2 family transcriptional regulator [Clostridia bacterium]|nr:Rrf2 family transcriptional regulator [Clostridia bacterium]